MAHHTPPSPRICPTCNGLGIVARTRRDREGARA